MRTSALVLACLALLRARPSAAETAPTPAERYRAQEKSTALAVTLEAVCPLAGAGAFYAGQTEKGTVLMVLSAVAAGVAVGSAFELAHLANQSSSGAGGALLDVERGGSWVALVGATVWYVIFRVSGLALAPEGVASFNADLRERLGAPPDLPPVPFHAAASTVGLTLRF